MTTISQDCRLRAVTSIDPYHESVIADPKLFEGYVRRDLLRSLAHAMLNKAGALRKSYPDPTRAEYRVDLYVFTPAEFHAAVREEVARYYMKRMQGYPEYQP